MAVDEEGAAVDADLFCVGVASGCVVVEPSWISAGGDCVGVVGSAVVADVLPDGPAVVDEEVAAVDAVLFCVGVVWFAVVPGGLVGCVVCSLTPECENGIDFTDKYSPNM